MHPYSLYIHIPFCERKCAYCDFLSFPADEKTKEDYVTSLCHEIQAYSAYQTAPIKTIFMGGGTPTSLKVDQLQRIFDTVYHYFSIVPECEITIEANPKTVTPEIADFMRLSPINRVSIGLQSTYEKHLKKLGRIHDYSDFLETYRLVREAGITNINVDLMFGLPDQSLEEWIHDLETIARMEPTHISAYSLIIEEGTPFYKWHEQGKLNLPDEDVERDMFHASRQVLENYGFHRYEISNYSKPGYECRHNIAYWTDVSYIGCGLGAASYIHGARYKNTVSMADYLADSSTIERIRKQTDAPSRQRRMEERLYLGLRLDSGIDLHLFNREFNHPFENIYKEAFDSLIEEGLLEIVGSRLKLTERGVDLSNRVFTQFLL